MNTKYLDIERLAYFTRHVLATLTPRDEKILRMRFGIGERKYTQKEIAKDLSISPQRVSKIESDALRKLRSPEKLKILKELSEKYQEEIKAPIELYDVIDQVDNLTLDLIKYLKTHEEKIELIPWAVFEHLVAEFLSSQGFEDVRLVGRDSITSADIYATLLVKPLGTRIRFFVEVKRERQKVGINIINTIFGAIGLEREKHGWHAGIIVSVSGFSNIRKHSKTELLLKGIDLKDKNDILQWLKYYEPHKNGLWLPDPKRKMPKLINLLY